jgi:plasmid stabilization system protein ParE
MEVKVLWTDTSLAQLQEIFDFYKHRAISAVARKIIKQLVDKSLFLESNPFLGAREPLL